jgi:hypothetical protein
VSFKITDVWNVAPDSLVDRLQRVGGGGKVSSGEHLIRV